MSRKHKHSVPVTPLSQSNPYHVGTIDAMSVTRAHMPHYNGFQCRGGVHGDTSYNRRRTKRETAQLISESL